MVPQPDSPPWRVICSLKMCNASIKILYLNKYEMDIVLQHTSYHTIPYYDALHYALHYSTVYSIMSYYITIDDCWFTLWMIGWRFGILELYPADVVTQPWKFTRKSPHFALDKYCGVWSVCWPLLTLQS